MRVRPALVLSLALSAPFALAHAQSGKTWEKSYPVNARPTLAVTAGSANIHTSSCGSCRAVTIHVDARDGDLKDYQIRENVSGNSIRFELKKRNSWGWGSMVGQSPYITVQTPVESDVSLSAGGGGVEMDGVHGNLSADVGSGGVRIANGGGHLHVQAGSGGINAEGRFSQFRLRDGSGSISLTLSPGTVLEASSSVENGSGGIRFRAPADIHANLDASSGSGGVHSDLPLTTQGSSGSGHALHGSVNGGGPRVELQAGSGGIHISGS